MKHSTTALVGAALGGALVGGLFLSMRARRQTKALLLQTGPGLQTTSGGGIMVTLQPGQVTQSIALDVQTAVIISLPTGSKWISVDGAPISDPVSPQAFVFLGPIQHLYVWTDASGTQQSTTLFFSVGSTVPTVNA